MIDAALLCAFIDVESGFQRGAFLNDRNGGSYGLAQIDLATAEWAGFGGTAIDLYAPRKNLAQFAKIAEKLAAHLQQHGKFSFRNLAAAYNAGLQHVIDGGSDAPYEEKIIAAYEFWCGALNCEIPTVSLEGKST